MQPVLDDPDTAPPAQESRRDSPIRTHAGYRAGDLDLRPLALRQGTLHAADSLHPRPVEGPDEQGRRLESPDLDPAAGFVPMRRPPVLRVAELAFGEGNSRLEGRRDLPEEARLIALDDDQVNAALIEGLSADLALAEHGVAGRDHPAQRHRPEQLRGRLVIVCIVSERSRGRCRPPTSPPSARIARRSASRPSPSISLPIDRPVRSRCASVNRPVGAARLPVGLSIQRRVPGRFGVLKRRHPVVGAQPGPTVGEQRCRFLPRSCRPRHRAGTRRSGPPGPGRPGRWPRRRGPGLGEPGASGRRGRRLAGRR